MHAEMRIDDSVIMLADAHGDWAAVPAWLHVYVPDVDATYQNALAAGGTQHPGAIAARRRPRPTRRRGRSVGNQWWISTQIS